MSPDMSSPTHDDPRATDRPEPVSAPFDRTAGTTPLEPDDLIGLLLDNDTLHQFLAGLATAAAADVDGKLSCGITVRAAPRRPFTFGSSDDFAQRLDEIQYAVGDGPCLTALRTGQTIEIDDTFAEDRWHEYLVRGAAEGVRASLSVPLIVPEADGAGGAGGTRRERHDVSIGALNLYAHDPRAFDADDRGTATRFAAQAAGAVAVALRLAERAGRTEHLKIALASRYLIDQALGILMHQHRCTAADAFNRLRAASQHRNRKLRDLAADLIRDVSGHDPQPPPDAAELRSSP